MATKLLSFRVTNFRSIIDSGEITTDDCTCLVGTNEAGKTNLLLALWKLNPANDEPIIPLSDYPRKSFVDYKGTKGGETFIDAQFELDSDLVTELADELGCDRELVKIASVGRRYSGTRTVSFPHSSMSSYSKQKIEEVFQAFDQNYKSDELFSKNEEINEELLKTVEQVKSSIPDREELSSDDIETLIAQVDNLIVVKYPRKQNLKAFIEESLKTPFEKVGKILSNKGVVTTQESRTKVVNSIPKFVYYSDYGNLDSEIYLPHVLENFDRDDLGERERAKARSLKVLFEFVRLEPKEILELGKEAGPTKVVTINSYQGTSSTAFEEPTDQDIDAEKEKKKEREVLLQSASTKLSQDFRAWWKQGEYRFRFQADGSHFRIWVSDDKRPEEIELEGRSKGLQWFFSFFLVFLVESKDSHSNCILLLDEPGLSLHPIAQQDLIEFFHTLSHENQIVYTTHSPFLVSPNDLGNIKALYVDDAGKSVVSSDLRANAKIAEKSIYPIHAAIGLTVSDTLLLGSQPVLVEGTSDQIYLQQIKNYLLSIQKFKNSKEIVFIPTGGVKGMSPVIKILAGRENTLPFVIMDADSAGKSKEKQLHGDLYKDEPKKVIMVDSYVSLLNAEIEDLIPGEQLARIFSKTFRGKKTDDFDFLYSKGQVIVPQMEQFARDNEYLLELGWKVDMAKEYTKVFDRLSSSISAECAESWEKLFAAITN